MNARTVMVTGVGGGGLGEQVVKALRRAERPYRIVGADVTARSLGLQEVDVPVILPMASAPEYVDALLAACRRLEVRAVYPGSEPELIALAAARLRLHAEGVVLFANRDTVIATGLDKGATAQFLASQGFHPPRSMVIASADDLGSVPFLPAILKPRAGGGGSANVFIAQTASEIRLFGAYVLAVTDTCLAQEYVGRATDEYTVGVLSDLEGRFINSVALRRHILSAFSHRLKIPNRTGDPAFGDYLVVSNGVSQGEIGTFPEVTGPCERMAAAMGSAGPLNLQCRLVDGEVRVFEINPRFSGTASIRAMIGFNEPDLLYRLHVEGERLVPRFGYRAGYVARGLREVLLDDPGGSR